jgi:uncharacterized membrane protein
MRKSIFYMIVFLLVATPFYAMAKEQVNFRAKAQSEVVVGEQFEIVYTVNAKARGFVPPDFKGLDVLAGPNTSSSSSIQFINGKMSQSYVLTYSFVVMAQKEGDIEVGPATVTVDGKKYASNTLQIKVIKGAAGQMNQARAGSNRNSGSRPATTAAGTKNITNKDVFVQATVNNKNPYLGQQLVVTYRIYTRVPVSNLSIKKVSSFKGFWSKDLLADNATLQQHNETINGQQYVVATIRKLALIPQQTGKLSLEPMALDCNVQLRVKQKRRSGYDPFDDFFNDPFFNQNVRNVKKTLVSNPVIIRVKPLPEKGKPACFDGAVGNFGFKSAIDKANLSTNDALTLSLQITGSGNIELIDAPKVSFPSDFETYDPKITSNIKKRASGVSGSKKFEYLAIPRNPGDFIIKPVSFCFFNPRDGQYHTFRSDTLHIHVTKGKGGGGVVYSGNAQEDIRFIGKDIRHIKEGPYQFRTINHFFFGSFWYVFFAALPVAILLLMLILFKILENRQANVSVMKNRKAKKVAKQRLMKAQKLKKQANDVGFYDEIAQALWGYISDKFNLQSSELSMDTVKEMLAAQQVNEETIKAFLDVLNNIEFARFAPGDAKGKMENIYSEAMQAIMQAEKSLK